MLTIWLRLALPESMMGWERHQLFRFAADYWASFSDTAYPVLLYIQAFFTQFYLYPLFGGAVIGGLFVLGMAGWHTLTGRRWTGIVWAALMLPLIPYFNLLWILVWLVMLGGGLLVSGMAVWRPWLRYMVLCLMGLLSVLLLQENGLWAVLFWAVVYGVTHRSWRSGLCALGWGLLGVSLGVGLLFWKGYPYYYTIRLRYFVLLGTLPTIKAFPFIFFYCPLLIRIISYLGLVGCLVLPCVRNLGSVGNESKPIDNRPVRKHKQILVQGGLGLTLCGLLIGAGFLNLRYQMEDYYLVYRLTAEKRYTEALNVAEVAFFERELPEKSDKRRGWVLNRRTEYHTLAARLGVRPVAYGHQTEREYMGDALRVCLLNSKQATERLFFYNGLCYFPVLFGENTLHMPSSHFMARYYTQNGLYAEALQSLYDMVTSGHIGTTTLEPLLWNSVVVRDYAPCRKFIRMFEQSLFHKDIARRYTAYLADTAAIGKQTDIAAARLRLSSHNHTVLTYNPDDNTHFRLINEANDAPFYEYALALWMVYKNHPQILAELPKIRQHYGRLPRYVQEAVAANFTIDHIDEIPDDVSPEIKNHYIEFLQAANLHSGGYLSLTKLNKDFGNTYWFYLYHNQVQSSTGKSNKSGNQY